MKNLKIAVIVVMLGIFVYLLWENLTYEPDQ